MFLFSALASCLLLTICIPLAIAQQTEAFTVDVLSSRVVIFNLEESAEVKGSFTVSGGVGDIDFYIINPDGERIIDLGHLNREAKFEFSASASGPYTLRFDNSFSWFTPKEVTLRYEVEGETSAPIIPRNVQISVAVEAAIIIGLILLGVAIAVLLKRSRK